MALDLTSDPAALTAALIDIPSVSGDEQRIADEVEQALRALDRYEVIRLGNTVLARTQLGLPGRVLLAGHLDTVPIADNVPSRTEVDDEHGPVVRGCGSTDMKSGDAMLLHLAATVTAPTRDLTFVFYECEEVDHERNGLTRVERELPDWLQADLAILGEPTDGMVEGGCQGTLTVTVTTRGVRAHSARSWKGHNAIHDVAGVLAAVAAFDTRSVELDGCRFREGLNAVRIEGGVAGNVVPDECAVQLNFRYAPDRSAEQAEAAIRDHFAGFELSFGDNAAGALPGLERPAAAAFLAAAGGPAKGKLGWTDVARFAAAGMAAVNYGPGDPMLAHTRGEFVEAGQVRSMTQTLGAFLTAPVTAGDSAAAGVTA